MSENEYSVPSGKQAEPAKQRSACTLPMTEPSDGAETAVCPACGAGMRLWAAYYRCRNCGFKESCCF